jgi:hypothetical protein
LIAARASFAVEQELSACSFLRMSAFSFSFSAQNLSAAIFFAARSFLVDVGASLVDYILIPK